MLVVGATVAAAVSGMASAGENEKGRVFNETFTIDESFNETDFCGTGKTVHFDVVGEGRSQVVLRGRDQLPYYAAHIKDTTTATNPENGKFLISTSSFIDKDLQVTDAGGGFLRLIVLATGVSKLYGENGKVIARDPGQTRIELLLDTKGTPNDPTDDTDQFVGVVKESTGRSDDYCEVAVPILFP